ncbi:virulence-associated E family protein [Leuconostoc lactis]
MVDDFEQLPDEPEWYKGFNRTKAGAIRGTVMSNVVLVLKNDPLFDGVFKFNDFTEEEEIAKTIKIDEAVINKGIMRDVDVLFLISYLERHYGFTINQNMGFSAISLVSQLEQNKFNPKIDYFDKAERMWDKVERSSTFLPEYLGAPKNEITTLITETFFIGAVAKVYNPMTKFDFSLDIVGDQGTGKTTLLKKLGRDAYVDTIQNFKNKDEYTKMQRALIVNDDEMEATASSTFDVTKKFITMEELEYRPAYGHKNVRRAKHFVLARTSNQVEYLKDKTGNRRFLPILSSKAKQVKHPFTDLNERDVMQFWGEMVHKYKTKGLQYPTREQEIDLAKHREKFVYVDEIENQINRYVDNNDLEWVASSDIAYNALNKIDLVKNRSVANKIKNVMDNKDGWKIARRNAGRGWKRVTQMTQQ